MNVPPLRVLAVFPQLHGDNPGGVQVSGQIAWEALQRHASAHALVVTSRTAAIAEARRIRFAADLVLFWHLDLLRLAPLLRIEAPCVLFLHGIEAWRKPGVLTRILLRNTRVLANSRYTAARARASMPGLAEVPVQIVHLGVGLPEPASMPPAAIPAAVMIGRLDRGERYKGHHEMICVWRTVISKVAGAQLWIVGDGDLRAELETLVAQERLSDHVRFFGRVSEAEKAELIRAARCLALPSRAEGFGLVYLEAMRAGRPCLVGVDAGVEVVDPPQAGLSVDPADADQLANAVIDLLLHSDQWQQRARARYQEYFTAQHFQTRLLSALRTLR